MSSSTPTSNCWRASRNTDARRALRYAALIALAVALRPGTSAAQQSAVERGDAMLRAGRAFAAESLYYRAVWAAPRDPAVRLALGRYLAGRGKWKVGAVLMEEARYFGGDAQVIAGALAPVYARLGEYASLSALPGTTIPAAERARADWLRSNLPAVGGADSTTIPYEPSEALPFGRIRLLIGTDTVVAAIDPRVDGLYLDTAWARRPAVRRFAARGASDPREAVGVALRIAVGDLTMANVPVRFAPQRGAAAATVGLDLLGSLTPTFDPMAGTVLLRHGGKLPPDLPGTHLPTLTIGAEPWIIRPEGMLPLSHPDALSLLNGRRWTLAPARGEIVLAP